MAHPHYNQYQQNMHSMPPLQTQNQMQNQRAFSPPSYQQSPAAMSPTSGAIPPAKRQRLSPTPAPGSPYGSPFPHSPYSTSPYATSPPANQYLSLPQSPASAQPMQSFNQPQPYQHPHTMDSRPPPQGSMPPPRVPASRTQENAELEKANPRDMDVNNISDVLTGSGIDLRAEEEAMLNVGSRNYGTSFNSQASGSTISPHGSFNQWGQSAGHGAFQGTGPLSQPVTRENQEAEFLRKHEQAARILNETASQPLTDPFLFAGALRQRVAKRAYEHGISLNLEGLFDKIPERTPQNVTRTTLDGSNGESIVGLQASSLLNQNSSLVDILSLLSLAAEDRVRTVIEDSFALSQARQNTSQGVVPPSLADLAVANGDTISKTVAPVNLSKTAWEAAPDSAVSPMTVAAQKQPPNAARLPTPPSEPPATPQPTIQVKENHVANGLKRKMTEDEKFEIARIQKRKKRLQGSSATPADTPTIAPLPPPEKMTKKERDRISKMGQTEEVLHRKANETASMALGGKKKYSWMTGGAASGASTPRLNTALGSISGTATPAQQTDKGLLVTTREFRGGDLESALGQKIEIRDLVHVLEDDGRERKTLVQILARLRSGDKDDKKVEDRRAAVAPAR